MSNTRVLPIDSETFAIPSDSKSQEPIECVTGVQEWRGFHLGALPGTDLWRKPPSVNSTNATYYITRTTQEKFVSAKVTVEAKWERLYDQGGLVLFFAAEGESDFDLKRNAWLKTGIEFYEERPNFSTVATPVSTTSDWSLVPINDPFVTLLVEREAIDPAKKHGSSLWVYIIDDQGKRRAVREVTWAFGGSESTTIGVGVYVARPTALGPDDNEKLKVLFKNVEVVVRE